MNIFEKIKAVLFENREELIQFFEAEQKALSDSLKVKTADQKKEKRTLIVSNFTKAEQKGVDGDFLIIKGVASNANIDRVGDVIIPEGIKIISAHNGKIPMLRSHDHDKVIGSWYDWKIQGGQFVVEGKLKKSYDPETFEQVKNGDLAALSVGFYVLDWEQDEKNPNITVFKEIDLFEVSVVAIGAHQEARITNVFEQKQKSADAVATAKTAEVEGEPTTAPDNSNSTEAEPVKEEVKTSPEVEALTQKVQELQTQLDNTLTENARLQSEMTEIGELLTESEQIIETLKEEKRIKYGLKNKEGVPA